MKQEDGKNKEKETENEYEAFETMHINDSTSSKSYSSRRL